MSGLREKERFNALNEVRILASISHPNIIGYKEAFIFENCLCIVMEHANGGDLSRLIEKKKREAQLITESEIWGYFYQILTGLKALHDMGILHRDLKAANIFLHDGMIKLGDLNVSKISKQGLVFTQTGTPYYASPEIWRDKPYDSRSDIWSFGCVVYELASLRPPFTALDMQGLYKRVIKGIYP